MIDPVDIIGNAKLPAPPVSLTSHSPFAAAVQPIQVDEVIGNRTAADDSESLSSLATPPTFGPSQLTRISSKSVIGTPPPPSPETLPVHAPPSSSVPMPRQAEAENSTQTEEASLCTDISDSTSVGASEASLETPAIQSGVAETSTVHPAVNQSPVDETPYHETASTVETAVNHGHASEVISHKTEELTTPPSKSTSWMDILWNPRIANESIEELKQSFIIGKTPRRDIYDAAGQLIVMRNQAITQEILNAAEQNGKLAELIVWLS